MKKFPLIFTFLTWVASTGFALAIPTLQLNIVDGTYDNGTDTTVASSDTFTLQAYLTPGNGCNASCLTTLLADTYYVSMAVVPKKGPAHDNTLGSFTYDGNIVNVTADMVYGTPPFETAATQLGDPGDLPDHGIFETFFKQVGFSFNGAPQATPFDVETNAGASPDFTGSGMYVVSFLVDVTNLSAANRIHFDLYNTAVVECGNNPHCVPGDIDRNDFAPFSHDTESDNGGGGSEAPEPGTVLLVGTGLVCLELRRWCKRVK